MSKGVLYVMTTVVTGLIKIGRSGTDNWETRMAGLRRHGYQNVAGLKPYFAIEVEDYDEKERLLQEVFSKHRVADSELFALDADLAKQLLLAFKGRALFPPATDQEGAFEEVTETRKVERRFSFPKVGIQDGETIHLLGYPHIKATVSGVKTVTYDGEAGLRLSPLTRDLYDELGLHRQSGSFQGAQHWVYQGKRLWDLMPPAAGDD
ncbi:MAG: GIY-YIG nuclease family protein [Promicromonosporaceae bacterium]|nr:GIY-YIG nuclease family protein [Promicromonosporaceae bacterium]